MSAPMERISSTKRPTDFGQLFATLAERVRPFQAKTANIVSRWHEWAEREWRRPDAVITGGAPDQVNAAVAEQQRKREATTRDFFRSHEEGLRAELEGHAAAIREHYYALVQAMEALRLFEHERNQFAARCSVVAPASIEDPAITHVVFERWAVKVAAVLHRPKPTPRLRAADNPLTLE